MISKDRMDKYTSDAQDFVIIKPAPKKKPAKTADKPKEKPAKSKGKK